MPIAFTVQYSIDSRPLGFLDDFCCDAIWNDGMRCIVVWIDVVGCSVVWTKGVSSKYKGHDSVDEDYATPCGVDALQNELCKFL